MEDFGSISGFLPDQFVDPTLLSLKVFVISDFIVEVFNFLIDPVHHMIKFRVLGLTRLYSDLVHELTALIKIGID